MKMKKTTQKTVPTTQNPDTFLDGIEDLQKRDDCRAVIDLASRVTGFEAKLWGAAIIGFGSYHYRYESGREGDAPLFGFSPRKNEIALYIANFNGKEALLEGLGKYKTAKACVYVKKLSDIHQEVLMKLISGTVKHYRELYP
jgi:hypothetical protein